MGFENLSETASIAIFVALGVLSLFVLIYLLVPGEAEEGRIVEKGVRKDKDRWVKVVFQTQRGKKKSFMVDRTAGEYIFPGERGILQKKSLGKKTYASMHSGLQTRVSGTMPFALKGLLLYGFFALVVVVPYFVFYDQVQKYWGDQVVSRLWAQEKQKTSLQEVKEDQIFLQSLQRRIREAKKRIKTVQAKGPSPVKERTLAGVDRWLSQLQNPLLTEKAYQNLLKEKDEASKKVLPLLSSHKVDSLVQVQCLRLVGIWKLKESLPSLIGLLRSPNESVSFWADQSLQKISGRPSTLLEAAFAEEKEKAIKAWEEWYKKSK